MGDGDARAEPCGDTGLARYYEFWGNPGDRKFLKDENRHYRREAGVPFRTIRKGSRITWNAERLARKEQGPDESAGAALSVQIAMRRTRRKHSHCEEAEKDHAGRDLYRGDPQAASRDLMCPFDSVRTSFALPFAFNTPTVCLN